MDVPSFDVTLPLPTSVNENYLVVRNKKGGFITRSNAYKEWIERAACEWRKQYMFGVKKVFTGRLSVVYAFILNDSIRSIAYGSDISNREKALSDFLEEKFYLNDAQIDEQYHVRRLTKEGPHRVMVRVMEIPDRRYEDPMQLFKPTYKGL